MIGNTDIKPPASELVAALIAAEKQAKKEKCRYDYADLLGNWQLKFVSGTKTQKTKTDKSDRPSSRAKPMKTPGAGRYIPQWINVSITYDTQASILTPDLIADSVSGRIPSSSSHPNQLGAVINQVRLNSLSFQLSGPTLYWPNTNSLGFDFIYFHLSIGNWTLYRAPVRGGMERAQTFADQPLKDQAFFTFFRVTLDYIAARGKGGGLALWTRADALA